jgi:type VI secretion system protein ImpA
VAPGAAGAAGGISAAASREDMLRELERIAEFFRRTEPQSPLSYTLEEAVRRGRMSWPELMAEIVTDAATRDNILMQLGIRPPQAPGGEAPEGGSSW